MCNIQNMIHEAMYISRTTEYRCVTGDIAVGLCNKETYVRQ